MPRPQEKHKPIEPARKGEWCACRTMRLNLTDETLEDNTCFLHHWFAKRTRR